MDVPRDEIIRLSLTGPASHTLVVRPGAGAVTIGAADAAGAPPDLVVGPDDVIDWPVFDTFATPSGIPWPRWFTYRGNDTGFVEWSARRPVESFAWYPAVPLTLDASRARIVRLYLHLADVPLEIVLPSGDDGIEHLAVHGDPGLLRASLAPGDGCPALAFVPTLARGRDAGAVRLPDLPGLAGHAAVRDVTVTGEPGRQPVGCSGLLQFPHLERLELGGELAGLDSLARLTGLTSLRLRYCPTLEGLPPLDTWPRLTSLFAHDVEADAGRRLRVEIRQLAKLGGRAWEHTSVSDLRTPEWFATRYGVPFAGWRGRKARTARESYRAAQSGIALATSPEDVEAAVRAFVRALNGLPGLDTVDREEAGDAVDLLTGQTPVGPMGRQASEWFDDERDF